MKTSKRKKNVLLLKVDQAPHKIVLPSITTHYFFQIVYNCYVNYIKFLQLFNKY